MAALMLAGPPVLAQKDCTADREKPKIVVEIQSTTRFDQHTEWCRARWNQPVGGKVRQHRLEFVNRSSSWQVLWVHDWPFQQGTDLYPRLGEGHLVPLAPKNGKIDFIVAQNASTGIHRIYLLNALNAGEVDSLLQRAKGDTGIQIGPGVIVE